MLAQVDFAANGLEEQALFAIEEFELIRIASSNRRARSFLKAAR